MLSNASSFAIEYRISGIVTKTEGVDAVRLQRYSRIFVPLLVLLMVANRTIGSDVPIVVWPTVVRGVLVRETRGPPGTVLS